jgi:DNA primase
VSKGDVEAPDQIRIDLDPQPGTDFADAVWVAPHVRDLLHEFGMEGWPKTSGGRGVHVYVPIQPRWIFPEVRRAVIAFGRELERRIPGRVTMNWWKEERGEKIFIDYNQMTRDRTIASAYSIRPRLHAPVSAPVTWDELPDVTPFDFEVLTMPARFREVGDWHAELADHAYGIEPLIALTDRQERDLGLGEMPIPPTTRRCPASRCGCNPAAPRAPPARWTTNNRTARRGSSGPGCPRWRRPHHG